jgi:hypothetical protein
MATIVDSYSESNSDGSFLIYDGQPGYGQSFTGDGGILQSVKLYLENYTGATGTAYVKIYAHTGTFGTDGKPTGSALATTSFDVSTLESSELTLETFTFTGEDKITLTNGTKYVVTLEFNDDTDSISMGKDGSSPSHAGNYCALSSGTWTGYNYGDACFYVYADESSASVTPSASESASPSATPSLTISASLSASPSITPSSSISSSPSSSVSSTPSSSVSTTPSASNSPSPSPAPPLTMKLKIAKPGFNAITEDDPNNLVFSSEYETLKYHLSGTVTIEAVVDQLDQKFSGYYEHNLGYIPYFEAYVQETDGGTYLPVPFMKTGASTAIWYTVFADTTKIYFGVRMMSYTFDTYTFPFKYFIFKNSLGL